MSRNEAEQSNERVIFELGFHENQLRRSLTNRPEQDERGREMEREGERQREREREREGDRDEDGESK